MKINKLIKYLICPLCHNDELSISNEKIICKSCHSQYLIKQGIPIMITKKLGLQEKNQKKIFDKHYKEFTDSNTEVENWRLSMMARLFKNNFFKKINSYLDIGCGATGYTTIEAAKKGVLFSVGCDISAEAMIKAQKRSKESGVYDKTGFVVCTAQNLPFKPNTFDYVSLISILEHLQNDSLAINLVSKILKTKGYLFICVPNTYYKIPLCIWPFYYYTDIKLGHKRHYSIKSLNKVVLPNDFRFKKALYNGHFIKFIQLFLDKIKKINNNLWWYLEKKDINKNSHGVQLNVFYQKKI